MAIIGYYHVTPPRLCYPTAQPKQSSVESGSAIKAFKFVKTIVYCVYCPWFPCGGYWSSVYFEAGGVCAVRCCSSVIAAGNSGLLMLRTVHGEQE